MNARPNNNQLSTIYQGVHITYFIWNNGETGDIDSLLIKSNSILCALNKNEQNLHDCLVYFIGL